MKKMSGKQHRRTHVIKRALSAFALAGLAVSAQAGVVLQENFNNVPGLTSAGWVLNNASTPAGSTAGWYQGDQGIFAAQNGAPESYAAANYNNAAAGGTIYNWLITPVFSTADNVIVTFWLNADQVQGYSDQVAFGFSAGGSTLTDFVLGDAVTVGGGWTKYTVGVSGQGAGATGRLGIRYFGAADSSNYVGLDNLTVTVPEPSTGFILGAGLLGLLAARRRKQS